MRKPCLLTHCTKELLPYYLLGLFCGIRPKERTAAPGVETRRSQGATRLRTRVCVQDLGASLRRYLK